MTKQKIFITSLTRTNYNNTTSSAFRVNFENPINGNIRGLKLCSATIPNTLYNIRAPINNISFTDSTGTINITVPEGNYSVDTLLTELENQLNLTTDTYTTNYNEITGIINITSSFAGFTLLPETIITNPDGSISRSPPSLGYQLGFNPVVTYPSVAGSLDAPNVARLQGIENLFIRINEFTQFLRNTANGGFYNFIIPNNENFNDIIYYTENSGLNQSYNLEGKTISNMGFVDIELLNAFNQRVDLNGSDWSLTLEFDIVN